MGAEGTLGGGWGEVLRSLTPECSFSIARCQSIRSPYRWAYAYRRKGTCLQPLYYFTTLNKGWFMWSLYDKSGTQFSRLLRSVLPVSPVSDLGLPPRLRGPLTRVSTKPTPLPTPRPCLVPKGSRRGSEVLGGYRSGRPLEETERKGRNTTAYGCHRGSPPNQVRGKGRGKETGSLGSTPPWPVDVLGRPSVSFLLLSPTLPSPLFSSSIRRYCPNRSSPVFPTSTTRRGGGDLAQVVPLVTKRLYTLPLLGL